MRKHWKPIHLGDVDRADNDEVDPNAVVLFSGNERVRNSDCPLEVRILCYSCRCQTVLCLTELRGFAIGVDSYVV